ncbi:MAG: N-acetylmuramidase domain-containing protein [Pseudomonadota bacterium]
MKPLSFLDSLRSGGEISRKRIYHAAGYEYGERAIPDELMNWAGDQIGASGAEPRAFARVESRNVALVNGNPIIRFEPHKWRRYRKDTPQARAFDTKRNPREQADRWRLFEEMCQADRIAAILSHSFGAFQIMGFNHEVCGYSSPESFLEAMMTPEGQVRAFVRFVKAHGALLAAIVARDAATVARHYNGPAYRQNRYDEKWLGALND